MFKFNSDNLVVGQIKELLYTFNLPGCKVVKNGLHVYKDNITYIKVQS